MANLYDKASLVQIPSGYKDGKLYNIKPFDQPFEFSRGSSATRVNEDGLIETFYNEATNLLLQSNNFDTTWTTDNYARLYTPTSGILGYDGTNDGWLLDILGDTTSQNIRQSLSSSGVQTFSVYAKANTLDWMLLYVSAGTLTRGYFDIANGTLGSSNNLINSKITDAGNGWYRCSITFNEPITSARVYLANANNSIQQSSGSIYIQDAQLESGYFATPYIETTTEAVTRPNRHDTPRIDYTNGKALLLEPQRTNLVTYSEDFSNNFWGFGSNSTLSFVNDLNPSGNQGCYRLENPASSPTYLSTNSLGVVNNDSVFSVYVKSNTGGNQNFGLYYVKTDPTITTFTATTEWQRFQIDAPSGFYQVGINNGDDTYSNDILIYGAQVEQGSYATSYIPTNGQAETRLADVCNNAGDSTIFNDEEGVLFLEVADVKGGRVAIKNSDTDKDEVVLGLSGDRFFCRIRENSTNVFTEFGNNIDTNLSYKLAINYKSGDSSFWVNGIGQSISDNFTLNSLNELLLTSEGNNFYGKVKSLLYFDKALTDEELADLTT